MLMFAKTQESGSRREEVRWRMSMGKDQRRDYAQAASETQEMGGRVMEEGCCENG